MPGEDLHRLATAWTIGLDTMARAAVAAVTAVAEAQLRSAVAEALSGRFADWVFVDFLTSPPRRAVSAREPDPGLITALGGVAAGSCPVISSAISRCTPEVRGSIDDEWMLGGLPDGRPVTSVIGRPLGRGRADPGGWRGRRGDHRGARPGRPPARLP